MKAVFATWSALLGILVFIGIWLVTAGFGKDPFPFILLNLCLSCLAALQCFILLIAAKRQDQIASEVALHTEKNTELIRELTQQNTILLQQNTELTESINRLTAEIHGKVVAA
ncbi:MAG: DUF1003 domain-containing protein [Patescibacteria group bacterium]|nr:DUF1003 domain-containing protein [Patescibacteria group bacterium]